MKQVLRLLLITFGIMGIIMAVACAKSEDNGLNWKVDDFTFTDQDDQPFGLAELQGKVWIADFVFVNCVSVCPPMTSNMAILQNELKKANIDAEIVSFSVDPERDTPEVLKQYGTDYNVDFTNWHFLTGYTQKEVRQFAESSFKAVVVQERKSDQVIHDVSFFIVDRSGVVYSKYSGVYDTPFDQMIEDIKKLSKGSKGDNRRSEQEEENAKQVVPSEQAGAEAIYKQSCISCHGVNLKGGMGPNLQKIGATQTLEQIKGIIQNGKGKMPGFKSRLNDEQIEELAQWLAAKT